MTDIFLPGQRWVSHADSTLGLGIVTHADDRRVTLHFHAVEEERVYAIDRAPLTRLLLKPGDQLTSVDGNELTVENVGNNLVYSPIPAPIPRDNSALSSRLSLMPTLS